MRFLVILALFFSLQSRAQVTGLYGGRYGLTYTPTDIFFQYYSDVKLGKFQRGLLFGFGVNRTIFQQRLYPELGFQIAFPIGNKVRFLPYVQVSISRLKVTDNNAHYWLNSEAGMRFEVFKSRGIGITAGYRNLIEYWYLDKVSYNTISFGLVGGIYIKV